MRKTLAATALALLSVQGVSAETFRWAGTTDPQTMDPHAVNSAPVLGFLNNVYEGLMRRNQQMQIEPALATSWEPIGSDGWRFHLRKDVKFHNGSDFTAEDVVFSYERATRPESDVSSWFASVSSIKAVDDYTVEFYTAAPNPIFPDTITNFMIMDKGWTETNNSAVPAKDAENFATRNTNGTGAFKVVERQPDLKTVIEPFGAWWDEATHNITSAEYTPIQNPATAVAALLSGEVDMINPVPTQDVARLSSSPDVKVLEDIEARVIMFGFANQAETLKYSADAGKPNPFKDARVRQAVNHAINVDAIVQTIMRGSAQPVSQLVSPAMRGYSEALADRPAYDLDKARALLAEAGYADGFSFGMRCPNNRYINDEAVCQAAVGMLAQIGLDVELETMPVSNYWPELRAQNFDMYMLGWSPGSFDAEHPIRFLVTTPNPEKKLGSWNFGAFSNARVDELLPQIQSEIDDEKRQALLDESTKILQDEAGYVPMYVQALLWGARSNVDLTQRADNFFMLRWVTVN
ncbi:ABC transporter substrate-binding protein [Epibacterium ulvae]|uniref:ABC transporter substrate-binding protein n=1 Tax=Epibacterium ulvae TaxID=1156985 RepID=UPI001BFC452C|nr:ABC transporter substrate-binding protein [Epibacterium ulvae]MBT8152709.1 ABC transporter substrate-binding protein [Epibacterium ulvae]